MEIPIVVFYLEGGALLNQFQKLILKIQKQD